MTQDNVFFTSNGLNRALPAPSGEPMSPPGVVHIERKRFLCEDRLYERITLTNYSREAMLLPLVFEFDDSTPVEINRVWIDEMNQAASSLNGLVLTAEPTA